MVVHDCLVDFGLAQVIELDVYVSHLCEKNYEVVCLNSLNPKQVCYKWFVLTLDGNVKVGRAHTEYSWKYLHVVVCVLILVVN